MKNPLFAISLCQVKTTKGNRDLLFQLQMFLCEILAEDLFHILNRMVSIQEEQNKQTNK